MSKPTSSKSSCTRKPRRTKTSKALTKSDKARRVARLAYLNSIRVCPEKPLSKQPSWWVKKYRPTVYKLYRANILKWQTAHKEKLKEHHRDYAKKSGYKSQRDYQARHRAEYLAYMRAYNKAYQARRRLMRKAAKNQAEMRVLTND